MCDTMVVAGPGRVLFAKNSDRDPNEAQALEWHPAREYPKDALLKCTHVCVRQVPRTHAILISRPVWMWGAEMGANACSVVIGNEAVFTREASEREGLTGMDLVRLALERAPDATTACETITGLIEEHGQGGRCGYEDKSFTYPSSFLVADPHGAFVIETAGRKWAIEKVTGCRSISNGLTIPGFAEKYAAPLKTHFSRCKIRQARTQAGLAGVDGVLDLFQILRQHGGANGMPHYDLLTGGMAAPCMHGGGLLASSQTTASWVSEITEQSCQHWVTATAAPCTSLFKPVTIENPVNMGPLPGNFQDGSFWWQHERFHRALVRDPAACLPQFQAERDAIEQGWVNHVPGSADAFALHRQRLHGWAERVRLLQDRRPRFVRRYWEKRNAMAQM